MQAMNREPATFRNIGGAYRAQSPIHRRASAASRLGIKGELRTDGGEGARLQSDYFNPTIRPTDQDAQREPWIQHNLGNRYRSRALEHLQEKVQRYAEQTGVPPSGVSARNFRPSRGPRDKAGQEAANGNIVKVPHAIADYVVAHELCQLIRPNHSRDFWQLVRTHDPLHIEHRNWLKEKGAGILR